MKKELTLQIIEAAIEVHRNLGGPGLLETVYEAAFCKELALRGMRIRKQVSVPVFYKGICIRDPLMLDILVNDEIVIEIKAASKNEPVFHSEMLTYLRLSGKREGLVINFGQGILREGVTRVVNNFDFVPSILSVV